MLLRQAHPARRTHRRRGPHVCCQGPSALDWQVQVKMFFIDWQQVYFSSSASLLLSAFLLDLVAGDPPWFPHPVVLMGKLISMGDRFLWIGNARRDFVSGMVLSLALIAVTIGATRALL